MDGSSFHQHPTPSPSTTTIMVPNGTLAGSSMGPSAPPQLSRIPSSTTASSMTQVVQDVLVQPRPSPPPNPQYHQQHPQTSATVATYSNGRTTSTPTSVVATSSSPYTSTSLPVSQPPIYQIQFCEENVGKYHKQSKKKLTWIFEIGDGRDGPGSDEDVGDEERLQSSSSQHTVSLTWSKSTGKQEIEMDGTVVWFGRHPGSSVFDHRWMAETTMMMITNDNSSNNDNEDGQYGHHQRHLLDGEPVIRLQLHILSTCAPRIHKTFRKHDFIINGQVFANLPTRPNHHEQYQNESYGGYGPPPSSPYTSFIRDGTVSSPATVVTDVSSYPLANPTKTTTTTLWGNNPDNNHGNDDCYDETFSYHSSMGSSAVDRKQPPSIFYLLYPDGIVPKNV